LVPIKVGSTNARYASRVKPISHLKANAAEMLTQIAENREPLVITRNGEAKAVLHDLASFEETQETLTLLKILALGQQQVEAGRGKPVTEVVARLRAKRLTKFRTRFVYRVLDDKVIIYLIPDGREDMQSLLARRMLGA
jgi:prevent-host-death family protein